MTTPTNKGPRKPWRFATAGSTFNPAVATLDASFPSTAIHAYGSATSTPFVYICDSGNNRIQVTDYDGTFLFSFGSFGSGNGQFNSPYGVANDGVRVYVTDSGNNRVQYFDLYGNYLGQWGTFGTGNGEFNSPKGIAVNGRYAFVVDQGNNRFQIFSALGDFLQTYCSYGLGPDPLVLNAPTDCYVDEYFLWIDDTGNGLIKMYSLVGLDTYIIGTFPTFTSAIVSAKRSGRIIADFPEFESTIATHITFVSRIDSAFPAFESDIQASGPILAVIDAAFPGLTSAISTSQRRVMILDATFPTFESAISSYGEVYSDIEAVFPGFTSEIISRISGGSTVSVVVINTITKAVSNFTNYDFNSMSFFAGKYIGADDTGIYEMDGVDDDTLTTPVDITASIRTGDFDLHEGNQPRTLEDVNLFGVFGSDITLIFRGNIDTLRQFTIPTFGQTTETTLRQKFGRGLKDRVFSLEIQNTDGGALELQQAAIDAEPVYRQKKR